MKKSVLIWMAALVCLFTIDATAAPEKKDPLKMYKAANLFAGGDYEGALKVYRQIYNSDKENQKDAELLFLMGRCFYLLNRYDEAATYLSQAYKYDPKADKDLALMLGQSYQKNGNLDSAEIMGNAALKLLDPANVSLPANSWLTPKMLPSAT
jgi:tetratricopeptide (TPR) repeat protein